MPKLSYIDGPILPPGYGSSAYGANVLSPSPLGANLDGNPASLGGQLSSSFGANVDAGYGDTGIGGDYWDDGSERGPDDGFMGLLRQIAQSDFGEGADDVIGKIVNGVNHVIDNGLEGTVGGSALSEGMGNVGRSIATGKIGDIFTVPEATKNFARGLLPDARSVAGMFGGSAREGYDDAVAERGDSALAESMSENNYVRDPLAQPGAMDAQRPNVQRLGGGITIDASGSSRRRQPGELATRGGVLLPEIDLPAVGVDKSDDLGWDDVGGWVEKAVKGAINLPFNLLDTVAYPAQLMMGQGQAHARLQMEANKKAYEVQQTNQRNQLERLQRVFGTAIPNETPQAKARRQMIADEAARSSIAMGVDSGTSSDTGAKPGGLMDFLFTSIQEKRRRELEQVRELRASVASGKSNVASLEKLGFKSLPGLGKTNSEIKKNEAIARYYGSGGRPANPSSLKLHIMKQAEKLIADGNSAGAQALLDQYPDLTMNMVVDPDAIESIWGNTAGVRTREPLALPDGTGNSVVAELARELR